MGSTFKIVFICIVFASFALTQASNGKSGNIMSNLFDFLRTLNTAQSKEFLAIAANRSLTKGQISTQETSWAAKQPSPILDNYNEYKKNEQVPANDMKARLDAASLNLTAPAKAVYDQMEEIKANQDITKKDEHSQIKAVLDGTTDQIRSEVVDMTVKVSMGDTLKNLGSLANNNWGLPAPSINLGNFNTLQGNFNPFASLETPKPIGNFNPFGNSGNFNLFGNSVSSKPFDFSSASNMLANSDFNIFGNSGSFNPFARL
uniref:DUF148 domain-containing protein n=1 Tax=Rhabditophanes sp. KR3021 TaxID=114890 RepID=A0AC35U2M1_9BILA